MHGNRQATKGLKGHGDILLLTYLQTFLKVRKGESAMMISVWP